MTRTPLKARLCFDILTDPQDRFIYLLLERFAWDGHGDIGACGVAEFDLMDVAEAIDQPPGSLLRQIKSISEAINAVCVEHENLVLFALAGACEKDFQHLYKSRGFIGLPPNLPKVDRRSIWI